MCWLAPGESSSGEQHTLTNLSYVAGVGRGRWSLLVDFLKPPWTDTGQLG